MSFTTWKRATVARLNAGSVVTQTARGAVEYALAGTGSAVLVIHGRPGGYDQGLVIARALNDPQFRFIAVSRPGYLRTPLETGCSPEDQADSFAVLLDVLGVSQAAVIALSAGGPSAVQFALRHPDRCWGVVLISARTQRVVRLPLRVRILQSIVSSSDAAGWLGSSLIRSMPQGMVRKMGGRLELAQTGFLCSLRRAGHANDLLQLLNLPRYPLADIRSPALVIHGTADMFVPYAEAEFAAGTIPRAQLIRIADAGHLVFFEQSDRLVPQILSFLKTHAPTGLAADAA